MTVVEYAFFTPMLFIVLMATVQFAVYLFAKQTAQAAVRAGDRIAREEAATQGCLSADASWRTDAADTVTQRAVGIGGKLLTFTANDITTSAAPDDSVQAACQASVTVSFDAGVPHFLPWMPDRISVTATGPVEQFVEHP
jgi:Flp pilus assembly protein TadG